MYSGYYRFPTIHDETVVFVSEDDLWTVPASGGVARRLTSNPGKVSWPRISPGGLNLAYVSRDEGSPEVYVMPVLGGPSRRLTFLGSDACATVGWLDENRVIFASSAGHWDFRFSSLFSVDIRPNQPDESQPLELGLATSLSIGPNGGMVLGRNTDAPSNWKRYRGGRIGQLWIDPAADRQFEPFNGPQGNLSAPMWIGERIYFISDHEGVGNLYSSLPDGSDLQRHTDHDRFYVRNASSDERSIVYHAGADLYRFDARNNWVSCIDIEFHSTRSERNRKFADPARYINEWTIHPQGEAVAVTTRGKLFSFPNWEGAVRQHSEAPELRANDSQPDVRYRLAAWLGDGKRMVAVSDAGGEEAFVIFSADGNREPQRLDDLNIGRPLALAANPFEDKIVFSNHRYELYILDLNTREKRLIDRGVAGPIYGFDWSPDGRWVAYSVSVSLQISILKLWNAETGEITPLTQPVLKDFAPAFHPRGRYLFFLSQRSFDPVRDELQSGFNFPRGTRPYLILLHDNQPSPFIPQPRLSFAEEPATDEKGHESQAEMLENENGAAGEPTSENEEAEGEDQDKERPRLVIDLEGIQERIVAFPVSLGRYGRVQGAYNGKVLYSRYPVAGDLEDQGWNNDGMLFAFDFTEQKEEMLISGIDDFDISADGDTLIYQDGRRLRVLLAGEKSQDEGSRPNRRTGWLDLHRIKLSINPPSEWRQMFREAWRLQREHFWTPDMSQVDWQAVYERYHPLLDRVGTRSELSDLVREMLGELGTSHAFEMGGDYRPEPNYRQGFLGADYKFEPDCQAWRITRIYRGDAWNPYADSPLNGPGVRVLPGDFLLAINGHYLDQNLSPRAALVNLADEEVILSVASPVDGEPGADREVVVKTLYNETGLRYRAWVETNRRRVHEASEGRVGYIHIPDMSEWGYAEFHRSYLTELDRQALVVDVRFNLGGRVSGLLLEKLARRRLGYTVSRWSQTPFPYPPESMDGPLVALTNEYTASDGDIFAHGFKMMNLGPVIGTRTWGGVVGIILNQRLVDNTRTTQPEFSHWFYDIGWGVENYGTEPDIPVEITPQQYAQGYDAQLERAIAEILHLLDERSPQPPDFSGRPSRALPRLPRRFHGEAGNPQSK